MNQLIPLPLPPKQRTKAWGQGFHNWRKEEKKEQNYWGSLASLIGNIAERAGASALFLSPSGLAEPLVGLLTTQVLSNFIAYSEGVSFPLTQWFTSTQGCWQIRLRYIACWLYRMFFCFSLSVICNHFGPHMCWSLKFIVEVLLCS